MKGTKYFMVVPLVEVRHFDIREGQGHENPAITIEIELANKHGFDSFLAVTNCYKSFRC